jgi:two-component system, LytTR family, response regulator LytT
MLMDKNVSDFLIVEDEVLIAESIVEILAGAGYRHMRIVSTVEQAVNEIELFRPDMVLTDINLGEEKTGIDLGHILSKIYKIPFIYVTSHFSPEILNKALHTKPNSYIIKPFKNEDLLVAIELALFNSNNKYPESLITEGLLVKEGHAMVNLAYDNITWLEAKDEKTLVNVSNGKHRAILLTLSEFEARLQRKRFIRIHPSLLVNCSYVSEIRTDALLVNGSELPIEKSYQSRVASFFAC